MLKHSRRRLRPLILLPSYPPNDDTRVSQVTITTQNCTLVVHFNLYSISWPLRRLIVAFRLDRRCRRYSSCS